MATATQSRQMKRTLGDLLTKLSADEKSTKESAAKSKKAETGDPGGYTSDTTHPSKNVDDGTQAAPEGSHSAENEARVKEDVPLGIPDATPNDSGSQNEVQVDLGITSKSTGTDPAVEGDVKDRPEDPGTTSEVDTSVGEKYSTFQKMAKQSEETGSQFLAVLNKLAATPEPAKSNGAKPAAETKTADAKDPPPEKQAAEAVAGYELASAIAGLPEQDKQAAVKGIHDIVHQTVSRASNLATKTAEYLMGVNETLKKKAEGELPPEMGGGGGDNGNGDSGGPPAAEGNGENGGGDGDSDDSGGGGGPGGLSEADLIQLLTQGDQMGGAGGPPGAGGGGLDALLAGAGGGGGPPPDAGGGGMPPGAGGEQIDPAMLEQILQEVGATGGDLEKAMAAKEAALKTATVKQSAGRAKWGAKYDQVKKSVADLLGRKI